MSAERPQELKYWIKPRLGNVELLHGTFVQQVFSKHAHDGYALGVIERGALRFSYRNERWVASPGQVNLVIPGEAHDGYAGSDKGWTYRMFYLPAVLLKNAASEIAGRIVAEPFFRCGVLDDPDLAKQICKLHISLEKNNTTILEQESELLSLLTTFVYRHAEEKMQFPHAGRETSAVARARRYIEDNYNQAVSLRELSQTSNLSPFHLIRVFKKSLGVPPHIYLQQIRIKKGKELLAGGAPVAEAALIIGFADQSHFTRQFKQITGLTPGKYRNFVQESFFSLR